MADSIRRPIVTAHAPGEKPAPMYEREREETPEEQAARRRAFEEASRRSALTDLDERLARGHTRSPK